MLSISLLGFSQNYIAPERERPESEFRNSCALKTNAMTSFGDVPISLVKINRRMMLNGTGTFYHNIMGLRHAYWIGLMVH
jgi:hypothetical protein